LAEARDVELKPVAAKALIFEPPGFELRTPALSAILPDF
jgi:hypothetical protein